MTRHHKNKSAARLLRSLYVWHRYLGLAAATFVVWLALSGLLLNHTDDLQLDARHISSPALLDWYGIHAPPGIRLFRTKTLTLAGMGGSLYVNQRLQPGVSGTLVGAVDFNGMVVVALTDRLLLLTPAGELIERLDDASGLPTGISAIGVHADRVLDVRTAHGDYRTDAGLLHWTPVVLRAVRWASPATPSATERAALEQAWRGNGLTVEQVLLDLHSGRILGKGGPFLMDAATILFLLLAFSGVWLWGRRRASTRAHQRKIASRAAEGAPGNADNAPTAGTDALSDSTL
jgi:hypothetical protein